MEERSDIRQDLQMPPGPLPSRFSDWSSLDSPHARTSPPSAPDIRMEQNENIQGPLNVPSAVITRQEGISTISLEEVHTSPQTEQQREEPNIPTREVVPAPLNIEVRTQRNDVASDEENDDVQPVSISGSVRPPLEVEELISPPNVQSEAVNVSAASGGSHVRTQDANVQVIPSTVPLERLTLKRDTTMVSENINIAPCYPWKRSHSHIPSTYTTRDFPDDSSDDHGSSRE